MTAMVSAATTTPVTHISGNGDTSATATQTRERTTWWPVDLETAITGENPEPSPRFLIRSDHQPLIYPGKINGIIGASESGKTWIALLAVQQAITDGITVTYIDFEDTAPGIITRLMTMNTDVDLIPVLRGLGMEAPFDPGAADFSGITDRGPRAGPPCPATRVCAES
jgi:hypothetical protein